MQCRDCPTCERNSLSEIQGTLRAPLVYRSFALIFNRTRSTTEPPGRGTGPVRGRNLHLDRSASSALRPSQLNASHHNNRKRFILNWRLSGPVASFGTYDPITRLGMAQVVGLFAVDLFVVGLFQGNSFTQHLPTAPEWLRGSELFLFW